MIPDRWDDTLHTLWTELGGPGSPSVAWSGPDGLLPSPFPVQDLAMGSVGAAACAARVLAAARGVAEQTPRVDARRVAASFRGDQLLRLDGAAFPSFAPLSGFFATTDGWVRTHANYPHHRLRLLAALGLPDIGSSDRHTTAPDVPDAMMDVAHEHRTTADRAAAGTAPGDRAAAGRATADRAAADRAAGDADRERVAASLSGRRAADVEAEVTAAGGIAVAVRSEQQWDAHPQGRAVAEAPLMERWAPPTYGQLPAARAPVAAVAAFPPVDGPALVADPTHDLPARGVRVLDLTRVIAGPVATRTLALLGADVLRVDPPGLPEPLAQHLDTGHGKRSTLLDLRSSADRATFDALLDSAHVVVTSYRPGALDAFGLDPDTLAATRPDLVVAALSAWGGTGPFAGRRGFDSIVQAACGIAARSAHPDGTPGALPAQALDHATGYLTAAAVLLALTDRVRRGTGTVLRPALARTAHVLRALPAYPDPGLADPIAELAPALVRTDCPDGRLRHPRPASGPSTYPHPPGRWGAAAPAWATA